MMALELHLPPLIVTVQSICSFFHVKHTYFLTFLYWLMSGNRQQQIQIDFPLIRIGTPLIILHSAIICC